MLHKQNNSIAHANSNQQKSTAIGTQQCKYSAHLQVLCYFNALCSWHKHMLNRKVVEVVVRSYENEWKKLKQHSIVWQCVVAVQFSPLESTLVQWWLLILAHNNFVTLPVAVLMLQRQVINKAYILYRHLVINSWDFYLFYSTTSTATLLIMLMLLLLLLALFG